MFDAVWTAALAINSTASKLPSGVTFKNFTYDDKLSTDISKLLYEEAKKVNFFGLTVSHLIHMISILGVFCVPHCYKIW